MPNEDATFWITFNGEIYNYMELRQELVRKGHRFRSRSDTEVILHLYEEKGAALLNHLNGEFAFVIYDAKRRRLFGARDRLGVKPLYYARSSTRFAFSSEPKALLALPDVSSEPLPEQLPSYLAFNCVPGPSTLYRDIQKLEPATLFEVTAEGVFRQERFWFPGGGDSEEGDANTFISTLDDRLRRAIQGRMISDVPLGAMLSGGLDSSLTVALMSEALGARVKTFTIGYPGDDTDPHSDLSYARLVARRFGTDHHEMILREDEIVSTLEGLPALADDPIGAPSVTANLQLAEFTRKSGVTVVQVGEGADEVFCGYPAVHRLWQLHERMAVFSKLLSRPLAGWLACALRPLLECTGNPSLIGSMDGTILEHLRRYSRGEHLYWGYGVLFSRTEQERLWSGQPSVSDPYEHLHRRMAEVPGFEGRPYLDQLALLDILLGLPERLLMRVDKATMLCGLEARVPFLDPSILKVAFQTPPRWRAASPKGFLKAYAQQKLPVEIVARRKAGFPTAQKVFLAPEVLSRLQDSVLDKRFLDFTGFDRHRLNEFFAVGKNRESHFFYHMWSLYMLSLWFHHWVEGTR